MSDQRPRNQRPRTRGGKGRLADLAAVERQQQSALELEEALGPEAEAMRSFSASSQEVVEHIRTRAVELAQKRAPGDVEPVVEAALDGIFGLGPLEPLLRDTSVRTIRLDGTHLYADGAPVAWSFRDEAHARGVIDRILASVGESLTEASGEIRVTMMDGSRVEARLLGPSLQVRMTRP